jgi:hypothetical protein
MELKISAVNILLPYAFKILAPWRLCVTNSFVFGCGFAALGLGGFACSFRTDSSG